jgi:omega-6 fatty acid desaturase (delta-12 desaturase)
LSPLQLLKDQKRTLIPRYTRSDDLKGLAQVLMTVAAIASLWWLVVVTRDISSWYAVAAVPALSLFTLRVFALMHECGHNSLFHSQRLNRAFGFVLGVLSGMPQYVWSRNHAYHHTHNGNWEKYRGPYTTLSVGEYAAMSDSQQFLYRWKCSPALAPLVGFIYLIFNPRYTWLRGSLSFLAHVIGKKLEQPNVSVRQHAASFKPRYWRSDKEYWHMFWNNAVLLSAWGAMSWLCGAALFFPIYIISVSLAGGVGIVLFTVQHNFEHAYASDTVDWDYDAGALNGTSFLILPGCLNWFTINIGYHHIHHLSPAIPNYCLVDCHEDNQHLFTEVRRLKLSDVNRALSYILWDTSAQRIISVAELRLRTATAAA